MVATVAGIHLGLDTHANRPAGNSCPDGSLYSCSTHNLVYKSNFAGNSWATWGTLSSGSGSVATDTIWDAAGDLAVGSGADTAARLAKGNAGGVLAMGNSAVIWNAGTSFPGSKATNDRYWRTDLGREAFWDGTRWLTTQIFELNWGNLGNIAANTNLERMPVYAQDFDMYLLDMILDGVVVTTNDGSHFWTATLTAQGGGATLGTATTAAWTVNVYSRTKTAINALYGTAATTVQVMLDVAKTSTPGNLYPAVKLTYRLVLT